MCNKKRVSKRLPNGKKKLYQKGQVDEKKSLTVAQKDIKDKLELQLDYFR